MSANTERAAVRTRNARERRTVTGKHAHPRPDDLNKTSPPGGSGAVGGGRPSAAVSGPGDISLKEETLRYHLTPPPGSVFFIFDRSLI
jgi:hypothetical protein